MASPTMPALAMIGATLMLIAPRIITAAMVTITTVAALRSTPPTASARCRRRSRAWPRVLSPCRLPLRIGAFNGFSIIRWTAPSISFRAASRAATARSMMTRICNGEASIGGTPC
jgi:hypothetical protein